MHKAIIFVIIAECWITIGQIMLKKSAEHLNTNPDNRPWVMHTLRSLGRLPSLWIGLLSMLAGLICWFAALRVGQLNFVYLLGSIQYIFALVAAHFFLNERINTGKIIGTLLITLGIVLTVLG